MNNTIYQHTGASFYDEQAHSLNPLRRWFHTRRHEIVRELLQESSKSSQIVDIGCGNTLWNREREFVNVTGVDLNRESLNYCLSTGRIRSAIVCPAENVLVAPASTDLVIMSEVLEHLPDPILAVQEAWRILRPGGIYIVTVPFDTWLSLWRPLFAVQCFIQGTLKRNPYYQAQCGHVNHFNPYSIAQLLSNGGFDPVGQFNMKRITIFIIARKSL